MRGLPQKQNARRADKIRLCGHLGRYKKIVKKTYIIFKQIFTIFFNISTAKIPTDLVFSKSVGIIPFGPLPKSYRLI